MTEVGGGEGRDLQKQRQEEEEEEEEEEQLSLSPFLSCTYTLFPLLLDPLGPFPALPLLLLLAVLFLRRRPQS